MSLRKKFHFIAIGGSVMHNLAIALLNKGYAVTGSDDEITDPSKSALFKNNLLPETLGWFPDKITSDLEGVIIGMHASKDNPELLKAQSMGLAIYSFPEFIYNQSVDKQRIVIGGSHGKTTITAIIIHVLSFHKRKFDYVIGAAQDGLEYTVKLSDDPIIVIEGDEYPCSPLDASAKFLRYQHHMAAISGIAWDHANIFPTKDVYTKQFELLADATPKGGTLVYNSEDSLSEKIGKMERADVQAIPYKTHEHIIDNGVVYLTGNEGNRTPIQLFGRHNLQNIAAAKELLKKIGITNTQFYEAITSFSGARGRLQKIADQNSTTVFKDFAHAPSKVRASVDAVKNLYPKRGLVGCLELHTYSSLTKNYLPEYKDSLKNCTVGIVYFNPDVVKRKGLDSISENEIRTAFNQKDLHVFTDAKSLEDFLLSIKWTNNNLVLMSSGHFNGLNVSTLANKLTT